MGQKRRRPDGWSPEGALEWLKGHSGASLAELCRAFETEECRAHALAYDVHVWRGTDADFRSAFDAACPSRNPGAGDALEAEPGLESWKVRWAEAYLATRDKIEASRMVGLSWAFVRPYLAERNARFDPHFKALVDQAESFFVASWESDLEHATRIARDTADARTLGFLSLQKLERTSREKWGRNETIRHEGAVEHKHVLELRNAARLVEERSKLLFADRQAEALPAKREEVELAQVVEAEVVE